MALAVVAVSPFSVGQSDGQWSFRHPDGKRWFSLGVCCTNPGEEPEKVKADNPAYSGVRLYGSTDAWRKDTESRLKKWGFNSLGGWSEEGSKLGLPYFVVLHLAAYARNLYDDFYLPSSRMAMEKAARDQIAHLLADPYLVGYFSDNELGWWREALFNTYGGFPKDGPGFRVWRDTIRGHYRGDFSRFQRDWSSKALKWEEIDGSIRLKPGGAGMQAVIAFQTRLARDYYAFCKDTIRRFDAKRLIMGDRYCQFYYPNVVSASKPHLDVVSTNYGAEWTTGGTTRYFLDTLHALTGKPVVITEFYMAAMENRTGNRNSSGGFPVVQTQAERAAAVTRYMGEVRRRPFVVGTHWFQYYDEPPKGRGDGEDYNMGLVDIKGEPYEGVIDAIANSTAVALKPAQPWPSYTPPKLEAGMREWPRDAALVPSKSRAPLADMYAVQDKNYLYLGFTSMGFFDEELYPEGKATEADRPTLEVRIGKSVGAVRFGGKGRPATCSDPSWRIFVKDGVKQEIVLAIPRKDLPTKVSASLWTHGRGERTDW